MQIWVTYRKYHHILFVWQCFGPSLKYQYQVCKLVDSRLNFFIQYFLYVFPLFSCWNSLYERSVIILMLFLLYLSLYFFNNALYLLSLPFYYIVFQCCSVWVYFIWYTGLFESLQNSPSESDVILSFYLLLQSFIFSLLLHLYYFNDSEILFIVVVLSYIYYILFCLFISLLAILLLFIIL